jgi:hypothetical protein
MMRKKMRGSRRKEERKRETTKMESKNFQILK